jgi:chemotaxis protein CheC
MENWSEYQDAITEIVNIGFGRAAASLSALLGQKVQLEAPEVKLLTFPKLKSAMTDLVSSDAISVHQKFKGRIDGDVLLLLNESSASILVDLLSGGNGNYHPLTISDREALLEVGNILLNAYIGSFGNLLKFRINFSIPQLNYQPVYKTLGNLNLTKDDDHYSLLVKTEFKVLDGQVDGYVVLIVDEDSLSTVYSAIKKELQ